MNNKKQVFTPKTVVIASVEQLYAWSNDGGLSAGLMGAGYAHQVLTPRRIISFSAPVSILENYDFEQPESAFPVLIELGGDQLCDRTFISFEDILSVHFRSEEELQSYERFPTPSFGMSKVSKSVSPDLFEGNPEGEPIDVKQIEFDQARYQKLEILAGSLLFVLRARVSDEIGTEFCRALFSDEKVDLPPLLQCFSDYRWGRKPPDSAIGLFVYTILDYTLQNLIEYRAIDSEVAAVAWAQRLLEISHHLDSKVPDDVKPPSERFSGMKSILSSTSALKELPDSSNPFRVMQYAILIGLMRRDVRAFQHWIDTSQDNCEEVQLAAAFILGFQCDRRSILDRKIRTAELDKVMCRAISESMQSLKITSLAGVSSACVEPLQRVESSKTQKSELVGQDTTIVIKGRDLLGMDLENLSDGGFTLTIRGSSLLIAEEGELVQREQDSSIDRSVDSKPAPGSRKVGSQSKSSKPTSGRKKVGSMAEPSVSIFDLDKMDGENDTR